MTNSFKATLIFFVLTFVLAVPGVSAQEKDGFKLKNYNREFCDNNWSNGDKASSRDLREIKVSGGNIAIDGRRNGGISVRGEDRQDVLVRACVQAWGDSEAETQAMIKNIRIETAGTIRAEGAGEENGWSVSYQVLVPRNTNLKLTTVNGGISIADVDGTIEFEAKNGGISLANLAGEVRGRTSNGGISVKLAGNRWDGTGLNVETTNGGVSLVMSESYAARVEAGTVNGGFSSDFPTLRVEQDKEKGYYMSRKRVEADLNGGGAPIRVVTTNGGVSIKSAK